MFCYQCEQTAKGVGCTVSGVCGKGPGTALAQDILTCEVVALAQVLKGRETEDTPLVDLIVDSLFTTITNVNFDEKAINELSNKVKKIREEMGGEETALSPSELFSGNEDLVSVRSTFLFGLRGMAAYAHHARVLGKRSRAVDTFIVRGMADLAEEHTLDEWVALLMDLGNVNIKCMQFLDTANTEAFGEPVPCEVPLTIEKGPFIVITGHDLRDLKMLLEQTEGKGINIYTHSEMLPAHGYPELKKYSHLKGNFGTAWQSQQKEFDNIPAPILFTTNCLMTPRESYFDRVFTTSIVGFEGACHIKADEKGHKDFSPIIESALKLGGYKEDQEFTGINGGKTVTTGYGRNTILTNAGTIVEAVKTGVIKHFFLVGGCDGARTGRNYYTEFVKNTPPDSIILTLACGKYRFNDIDLGKIGPFPRILDMGQCNDAYGAIQVALALAETFSCSVNELPLTLVLSWYEQKAVCILLSLLALGIKNIYIGPSIPAFFSESVIKLLVEKFNLTPIGTPKGDLDKILSKTPQ